GHSSSPRRCIRRSESAPTSHSRAYPREELRQVRRVCLHLWGRSKWKEPPAAVPFFAERSETVAVGFSRWTGRAANRRSGPTRVPAVVVRFSLFPRRRF